MDIETTTILVWPNSDWSYEDDVEESNPSFDDISRQDAYSVCGRLFKTLYGAQRHIAKIQLLQEIEIECRDSRVKGEFYDPAQEHRDLFLKKYGQPYWDRQGYSAFARAVTQRVKELRTQKNVRKVI